MKARFGNNNKPKFSIGSIQLKCNNVLQSLIGCRCSIASLLHINRYDFDSLSVTLPLDPKLFSNNGKNQLCWHEIFLIASFSLLSQP